MSAKAPTGKKPAAKAAAKAAAKPVAPDPVLESAPAESAAPAEPKPPSKLKLLLLKFEEPFIKMWKALVDPALGQRHLALLFIAGLIGSVTFFSIGMSRHLHSRGRVKAHEAEHVDPAQAMEAMARKKAELAEAKQAMVRMGSFEGAVVDAGVQIELEISVEFDSGSTGKWISANFDPARSAVLGAVATVRGVGRQKLLTPEGKERIRDQVRAHLDDLLPSGRVKDVFFTKFVIH